MTDLAEAPLRLSDLSEQERNARFAHLQERLVPLWEAMRLNQPGESILVVPSVTPDATQSGADLQALEERMLDVLEARYPACRVVRLRPALIFKRESARHVRNLFLGKLLPRRLVSVDWLAQAIDKLPIAFQVVHTDDVAAAIHRCVLTEVTGAFNLAADGVLGHPAAAGTSLVRLAKPAVAAAWRVHLLPIDPGWLTLAATVPLMSTNRAREELGWTPTRDAAAVLRELLTGLRDDGTFPTPPLAERRASTDATTEPALS